jgi:hypothetical protein
MTECLGPERVSLREIIIFDEHEREGEFRPPPTAPSPFFDVFPLAHGKSLAHESKQFRRLLTSIPAHESEREIKTLLTSQLAITCAVASRQKARSVHVREVQRQRHVIGVFCSSPKAPRVLKVAFVSLIKFSRCVTESLIFRLFSQILIIIIIHLGIGEIDLFSVFEPRGRTATSLSA